MTLRLCSRSKSSTSRAAPSFSFEPPFLKRASTLSSCGSSLTGFAGMVESVRPVTARSGNARVANGAARAAPQKRRMCSGGCATLAASRTPARRVR